MRLRLVLPARITGFVLLIASFAYAGPTAWPISLLSSDSDVIYTGQDQTEADMPEETDRTQAPSMDPNDDRNNTSLEAEYADFLADYIRPSDGINFLAYGEVSQEDWQKLKAYISHLETTGIAGLNRDEQMAFWINLYNAKTIDVILEAYPVKSVKNIGLFGRGPWDKKNMTVTGFGAMSLNNVEHDTLRVNWQDPRIHYAVNCASYGCPNLKATPWTADTLEADLEAAAAAFINHQRGVRVEDGKVIASKIFTWYIGDFGGSKASTLAHLRQYADGELKTALESASTIHKYEYDWALNAPPSGKTPAAKGS